MYIAMNRFQINHGFEDGFETLWRERQSRLSDQPGFVSFRLLRGPDGEQCRLYASHTVWRSEADFLAWTGSEDFRRAHGQGRAAPGTYAGHPQFEGFEVVVEEGNETL